MMLKTVLSSLLQTVIRIIGIAGNSLCPGDHIPWRRSLDGSESRIQHMLMASDAQLHQITTPFGTVNFVQVYTQAPWPRVICLLICFGYRLPVNRGLLLGLRKFNFN